MRFEEYMQELRQVKTLEAEQEAELWQSYKEQGDTQARRLIIESYTMIMSAAWRSRCTPCTASAAAC